MDQRINKKPDQLIRRFDEAASLGLVYPWLKPRMFRGSTRASRKLLLQASIREYYLTSRLSRFNHSALIIKKSDMSPNDEAIKKSVDYKVLIKSGNVYFNIGTIVIKTYTGDILYTPSSRFHDELNAPIKKEIEHVSWHAGGQVHIKYKDAKVPYSVVQKNGERQKISEIGFQDLLQDKIKEFERLPKYEKKVLELDVAFDAADYHGPACFHLSIISGKLIVAKNFGQDVPVKSVSIKEERNGIDSTIRALGHHSGNGDVILQYSLRKTEADTLRTNRQIYIPYDMKISKVGVKV